jgi:hypothetical protein
LFVLFFLMFVASPILRPRSVTRSIAMKLPKNLGMILLALWLILFGLLTAPFLAIRFAYSGDLLAILAMAAGVLLLLRRD